MDFLEKLDYLMKKENLNKNTLSKACDIPYTTIDGWYKKGYEGLKLTTLRKLANFFHTPLDFWANDNVEPNAILHVVKPENTARASDDRNFLTDSEVSHIKKYRTLDERGKKNVDLVLDAEYENCQSAVKQEEEDDLNNVIYFHVPEYYQPVSAGDGEWNDDSSCENLLLTKAPPKGTSYVVKINGDSMHPTYPNGSRLFIRSQDYLEDGQIGIFVMDSHMYVKELQKGYLISHNPEYTPILLNENARCQGKVLGVCDESYFKK